MLDKSIWGEIVFDLTNGLMPVLEGHYYDSHIAAMKIMEYADIIEHKAAQGLDAHGTFEIGRCITEFIETHKEEFLNWCNED